MMKLRRSIQKGRMEPMLMLFVLAGFATARSWPKDL